MRELLVAVLAGLAIEPAVVGRTPTASEIQARDITVMPDGRGLPIGRGTVSEGAAVYAATCASCHGPRGEGQGENPPLAGGFGTLRGSHPKLTVGSYWPYATTVWDYVHRAMPYDRPGTLPAADVYAVTAFLLHLNGIIDETAAIDAASLPLIRMPNRDGFVDDPRPDVHPTP